MDTHDKICAFLYFGYVPEFKDTHISDVFPDIESPEQLSGLDLSSKNESEIIDLGIKALKTTFANCLETTTSENHILPLSGGLDSRTILANLLELGIKERLTTVTLGVPGSWDYEIAGDLAGKFNISHKSIDLSKIQVSTGALIKTAQNGCAWTFLFDGFYNALIPQNYGTEADYWSGITGDLLAGQSVRPELFEGFNSWDEAILYYSKRIKAAFFKIIDLYPPGYDPTLILPTSPFLKDTQVNYFDQLSLFVTNQNYLRRVILPSGYRYITPFRHKDWVNFILRVPQHLRMKKYIYKKILLSAFPDLFSYPIKEYWGGSLKSNSTELFYRHAVQWIRNRTGFANNIWMRLGVYRILQYIDFNDAIRRRSDFKGLVRENIADLKNRNIIDWIDLDRLWTDHQNKKSDLGDELLLLTALEISLKVEDEREF